jgi:hypothetical protein
VLSLMIAWQSVYVGLGVTLGSRPVHIDDQRSFVEIYRLAGDVGSFVDPRQQEETLASRKVGVHHPLKGFGFYMFEPSTTSSMLTVPILPVGEAFIARHGLYAKLKEHPTGFEWQYSWERWQVFRTDPPRPATANEAANMPDPLPRPAT